MSPTPVDPHTHCSRRVQYLEKNCCCIARRDIREQNHGMDSLTYQSELLTFQDSTVQEACQTLAVRITNRFYFHTTDLTYRIVFNLKLNNRNRNIGLSILLNKQNLDSS